MRGEEGVAAAAECAACVAGRAKSGPRGGDAWRTERSSERMREDSFRLWVSFKMGEPLWLCWLGLQGEVELGGPAASGVFEPRAGELFAIIDVCGWKGELALLVELGERVRVGGAVAEKGDVGGEWGTCKDEYVCGPK